MLAAGLTLIFGIMGGQFSARQLLHVGCYLAWSLAAMTQILPWPPIGYAVVGVVWSGT
jgi:branched-subunit amino acid ABC-type transport system permease component